jgi:hypothetical protein
LLEGRLRKARQVADEHDWVRERIAQRIDRAWEDESVDSIAIEPRDLAALGDRTIHAGINAENLTYAVTIPFDPIAAATKYSRFLGEMEKQASHALGRPVTFGLMLYKIGRWDYEARRKADLQSVSFLTYMQLRETGLPAEALAKEIQVGGAFLEDAVVFTRAETGITHISQLPGHSVLFAHTNTIVSALGKVALAKKGICAGTLQSYRNLAAPGPRTAPPGKRDDSREIDFETSIHREVLARVIGLEFDAGIAPFKLFHREAQRRTNLVELLHFKKTPDLCIARAGLPREVIDALRKSLLSIRDKKLLGSTDPSMRNGFTAVSETEFTEFEKLVQQYLPWFETCGSGASSTNRTSAAPR